MGHLVFISLSVLLYLKTQAMCLIIQHRMLVNNEVVRMWKEMILSHFEVLQCMLLEGLRRTTKNLSQGK